MKKRSASEIEIPVAAKKGRTKDTSLFEDLPDPILERILRIVLNGCLLLKNDEAHIFSSRSGRMKWELPNPKKSSPVPHTIRTLICLMSVSRRFRKVILSGPFWSVDHLSSVWDGMKPSKTSSLSSILSKLDMTKVEKTGDFHLALNMVPSYTEKAIALFFPKVSPCIQRLEVTYEKTPGFRIGSREVNAVLDSLKNSANVSSLKVLRSKTFMDLSATIETFPLTSLTLALDSSDFIPDFLEKIVTTWPGLTSLNLTMPKKPCIKKVRAGFVLDLPTLQSLTFDGNGNADKDWAIHVELETLALKNWRDLFNHPTLKIVHLKNCTLRTGKVLWPGLLNLVAPGRDLHLVGNRVVQSLNLESCMGIRMVMVKDCFLQEVIIRDLHLRVAGFEECMYLRSLEVDSESTEIIGCPLLERLSVVGNVHIKDLNSFSELKSLKIRDSQFNFPCLLEELAPLTKLEYLELLDVKESKTKIGIGKISFPNLRKLRISGIELPPTLILECPLLECLEIVESLYAKLGGLIKRLDLSACSQLTYLAASPSSVDIPKRDQARDLFTRNPLLRDRLKKTKAKLDNYTDPVQYVKFWLDLSGLEDDEESRSVVFH